MRASRCRLSDDPRRHRGLLPPIPRNKVSEPQRVRLRSEDFVNRTRLTLSLKCALHKVEMRVRDLESHSRATRFQAARHPQNAGPSRADADGPETRMRVHAAIKRLALELSPRRGGEA